MRLSPTPPLPTGAAGLLSASASALVRRAARQRMLCFRLTFDPSNVVYPLGHLQILSFQAIPLALLAQIRLRERPGGPAMLLFVIACLAQALVSWYLAVMLAVVLAVVAIGQRVAPGSSPTRPVVSWHEVLAVVVIGAVLFPFARPYARSFSDSTLAERRQLVDTFGDAVGWRDFVTPPAATLAGSAIDANPYSIWGENTLYIGAVPCLLALVAIAVAVRRREQVPWTAIGLVLVAVGFTLALGFFSPALGVRLPLGYLAQALPFLAGLRAAQRFALVLYVGVLLLSAWGVAHLARRTRWPWVPAVLASCLFLVEVFPITLPVSASRRYRVSAPDAFIAAYQHAHPDRAPVVVLHLPIHYFDQSYPVSEATYMVDSTAHWARILNGFSGGVPSGFMARMKALHRLPAPEAVDAMLALGVDILALHGPAAAPKEGGVRDYFTRQSWAAVTPLSGGDAVVVIDRARAPVPRPLEPLPGP
ncbi:MAG: hypothetical protein FJ197_12785 [Gammaproteobacteria bacterium]|nr:hypothetical protein [Gammaproteobacteria bacterium]